MKFNIKSFTVAKDNITAEDLKEAERLSGIYAGICYMPNTFEALEQNTEAALKRVQGTLKKGHHSVMSHIYMTVVLEGIPKILAMLLNSVTFYNTSEKSGRYTEMKADSTEKELYDKWRPILKSLIMQKYPDFEEKYADNLAKENARYFLSVFANGTTMAYTTSIQQWNYIYDWCEMLIEYTEETAFLGNPKEYEFFVCLVPYLKELQSLLKPFIIPDLRDRKKQGFKLFDINNEYKTDKDYFGYVYNTTYEASFVAIAQLHRHRTLRYRIRFTDEVRYFIPDIVKDANMQEMWVQDMQKVEFPNALLMQVTETGDYTDFLLKCKERLCGRAQYETAKIVSLVYKEFAVAVPELGFKEDVPTKACLIGDCTEPCPWGCVHGVDFNYRIV